MAQAIDQPLRQLAVTGPLRNIGRVIVQPESDWERAMVKWFNRVRGFGFLMRAEGTPDVFVHMETLRRFGFTELRPGQMVLVRWGLGRRAAWQRSRPDGQPGLPPTH